MKTNIDDAVKALDARQLNDAKTLIEQMSYDLGLIHLNLDAVIHEYKIMTGG
jgi:hypothetical protein